MSVPTVKTWNGTRVIVTTERGEFFVVLDTATAATRYAAELRGALADAFHAGVADANGDDDDAGPELWADLP
jgi:hypothetical protein